MKKKYRRGGGWTMTESKKKRKRLTTTLFFGAITTILYNRQVRLLLLLLLRRRRASAVVCTHTRAHTYNRTYTEKERYTLTGSTVVYRGTMTKAAAALRFTPKLVEHSSLAGRAPLAPLRFSFFLYVIRPLLYSRSRVRERERESL